MVSCATYSVRFHSLLDRHAHYMIKSNMSDCISQFAASAHRYSQYDAKVVLDVEQDQRIGCSFGRMWVTVLLCVMTIKTSEIVRELWPTKIAAI